MLNWFKKHKKAIKAVLLVLFIGISLSACSAFRPDEENKSSEQIRNEAIADCWQCSMFTIVYNAGGNLATSVYDRTTEGASALIMIMFGVWMMLQLMGYLGSVKFQEPAEFWKKIGTRLFVCFVCSVMVASSTNVFWVINNMIMPIFVAFLDFGSAIIDTGSCSISGLDSNISDGSFPAGPGNALECLIAMMHKKLVMGKALGTAIMLDETVGDGGIIAGLAIIVLFAIVDLVFPFYIIDSIIRLGIAIALAPILIITFAFPGTRKFSVKGFELVLNCGMTLATTCIIITLMSGVLNDYVAMQFPYVLDPAQLDAGVGDQMSAGASVLAFITIGFLFFTSVKSAPSIASSVVGAAGLGGVAALMAKSLKGLISMVTGGVNLNNIVKNLKKKMKKKGAAKAVAKGAAKGAKKGAAKGAKAGAKIGSALGPVGTAVGGAVGTAAGGAAGGALGAAKGAAKGGAKSAAKRMNKATKGGGD